MNAEDLQNLVYRDERTGALRNLDHALETNRVNDLTYERDLEIIATYGVEDPNELLWAGTSRGTPASHGMR